MFKVNLSNLFPTLMQLDQSVVLWQGRGGIQKIALFVKISNPYYGKNSSNKQRETPFHHYFKTWRSVISRTLKVSSSAVAKTIKLYDETGSWETPQENLLDRVQITDTSQHQLFREDCVNQSFMVKLLQRKHYKKKRLALAKKHEQWTLDRWKFGLESKFEIFCQMQSRWTDHLRMCVLCFREA